MSGLLIRLAAPMQSWGEHSTFSTRDTTAFPTRSGLIGLIAGALGRRRGDPIEDLAALRFTIRVDRPGTSMMDFHTVGGGLRRDRTVPTASGGRKAAETTTIVSRRYYLADAAFAVAVEGPQELLTVVARGLRQPVWAPFLGRRSCPAEAPLLIRSDVADPVTDMRSRLPVARWRPRDSDAEHVELEFIHDAPVAGVAEAAQIELNDVPLGFEPLRRRYVGRMAYVERVSMDSTLCAGTGRKYLAALASYINGGEPS